MSSNRMYQDAKENQGTATATITIEFGGLTLTKKVEVNQDLLWMVNEVYEEEAKVRMAEERILKCFLR